MTIFQRLDSSKIQKKKGAYGKKKIRRRYKKIKVGDDENPDFKLVSEFLKQANEDILFEIFLRLPNCRSAILLGSVCRGWQSLISGPEFIPSFIRQHREHQDRYSLPFTIICHKVDVGWFNGAQHYQPICKIFSKESVYLHGKAAESSAYLDFMPCPINIRASFDDLLLVSSGDRFAADYYICNPVTKQFYQLPDLPVNLRRTTRPLGFALVCSSKPHGFAKYQYKVVIIHSVYRYGKKCNIEQRMSIFCSEAGCWRSSIFYYPRPKEIKPVEHFEVVTCNGVVYWLESEWTPERILSFDLYNSRCGVIDFPRDFGCEWNNYHLKAQLAVVGTELRLLVIFGVDMGRTVMKVWKLNYKDSSWVLVHEKSNLKKAKNERIVGQFFHPTNGDVIFMLWGKHLFQYQIVEDTYELLAELDESIDRDKDVALIPPPSFLSFPLVHPTWPTQVPPSGPASI